MGSMQPVGTLVRGADGHLYDVSASGGRPTQDPRRGSSPGDAQTGSLQAARSWDYAASRAVIDPGDHAASRAVIDPGDHAASRAVIDPGDHTAA